MDFTNVISILVAVAAGIGAVALARALFERVTVFEYERGLAYRRGRFVGVIEPGQYWLYRPRDRVRKIDVRPTVVSIAGQEVLSADGVTLRVSLAAEYRIIDPVVAVNEVVDFEGALYVTLQLALREIIGTAAIDDLLDRRGEIGTRVAEMTRDRVATLGLELRAADLKDIMFPGDLKKMFAQVVGARKEGLAALEKARGETAALRNLANAARLVDGNPTLMQLRLLQQIAASAGNTIVLGLPPSTTPLPMRGSDAPDVEAPQLPPDIEPGRE